MDHQAYIVAGTVIRVLKPERLGEFCRYFQLRGRSGGLPLPYFDMLMQDSSLTPRVLLPLLTADELRRVCVLAGMPTTGTEHQLLERLLRRCARMVPELEHSTK